VQTAQEYLRSTEPELFTKDEQVADIQAETDIKDRLKKLHDAIGEHRAAHPSHTFAQAYHEVVQAHPELERGLGPDSRH